jgi:hypothetical protein
MSGCFCKVWMFFKCVYGVLMCVPVFIVCILFCMCMGVFVRCGCFCKVWIFCKVWMLL